MNSSDEVRRLLESSGRTQDEAADFLTQRLGRVVRHYHVSRMITGHRKVAADEMDALREMAAADPAVDVPFLPLTHAADSVPLFAAGGVGAPLRLGESNRVGDFPLHPSQRGARDAFAFVMDDDGLGDRLRRGEVGHVLRGRTPLPDMPCLVEYVDGHALARIYVRQDDRTLFVRTAAPKATESSIPSVQVRAVHAISGVSFRGF